MDLANVGLKDYLIIGSITGFLRITSMQVAGYKQGDLTYWESYGTWTVSNLVTILIYATARWLLKLSSRKSTTTSSGQATSRAEDMEAKSWTLN